MSTPVAPSVSFDEAEKLNPYQLLLDLHTRASANVIAPTTEALLSELALAAAVVVWWDRWQPLTMHRAFLAGASLTEVADATGLCPDDVFDRWTSWTDRQLKLDIGGRPAVDPAGVANIRGRLCQDGDGR